MRVERCECEGWNILDLGWGREVICKKVGGDRCVLFEGEGDR